MDKLRCRAGEMAFIKRSWNQLLIGSLVLVRSMRPDGHWEVVLLGQPALLISEDRRRHVVASRVIAEDSALVPLRGCARPQVESERVFSEMGINSTEVCHA
ncbi:hypothetical protein PSP20601_03769 [Pandoraea sputorum]|nr:hypothetical protein PSP20601_03769 [Pandoraea sputorum]